MASAPKPVPCLLVQPRPCSAMPAASGSAPTRPASPAPWVLAERMAAGDQRNGFIVVHGHAAERVADVAGRSQRIRLAAGTFRVDVDETHLNRCKRVLQFAFGTLRIVAVLVVKPGFFRTPVDVLFRLPHIAAAAGESEGLEAHRFERDIAGQDHKIRPGDLVAVFFCFDRPDQPAGLVKVDVVGPAVERRENAARPRSIRHARQRCGKVPALCQAMRMKKGP